MAEKEKKEIFDVPVSGSLGLLAFGYKGVMVWRKKILKEKYNLDFKEELVANLFLNVPKSNDEEEK